MDFLDSIKPLLTPLELSIYDASKHLDNLRTILTHLAPFLGGTHAIWCDDSTLPVVHLYFRAELAQLKKLQFLYIDQFGTASDANLHGNVATVVDWLTQSDGQRRLFNAHFLDNDNGFAEQYCEQIYTAIRQVYFLTI